MVVINFVELLMNNWQNVFHMQQLLEWADSLLHLRSGTLSCDLMPIKNCNWLIFLEGLNQGPKGPVIFFKQNTCCFLTFLAAYPRLGKKSATNYSSTPFSSPEGSRGEGQNTWAKGEDRGGTGQTGTTGNSRQREEMGKKAERTEKQKETREWKVRERGGSCAPWLP